jgi:hypothetical protein
MEAYVGAGKPFREMLGGLGETAQRATSRPCPAFRAHRKAGIVPHTQNGAESKKVSANLEKG